jgi:small subunit ribosomal protein S27Ae
MGKKPAPKKKAAAPGKNVVVKKSVSKKDAYEVNGNKVIRKKPVCPKCGPGVFMAAHANRTSCGKCGYTEFKK